VAVRNSFLFSPLPPVTRLDTGHVLVFCSASGDCSSVPVAARSALFLLEGSGVSLASFDTGDVHAFWASEGCSSVPVAARNALFLLAGSGVSLASFSREAVAVRGSQQRPHAVLPSGTTGVLSVGGALRRSAYVKPLLLPPSAAALPPHRKDAAVSSSANAGEEG